MPVQSAVGAPVTPVDVDVVGVDEDSLGDEACGYEVRY